MKLQIMKSAKSIVGACILAVSLMFAGVPDYAQAGPELSPPLSIVADNDKDLFRVNFQCDECELEERINKKTVSKPNDVALGLLNSTNFSIVGSEKGKKARVLLFVEGEPQEFWSRSEFARMQGDAIVVTRNAKTVYVASDENADGAISAFAQTCGENDPVTAACWGSAVPVTNVWVDGQPCRDFVDLVEFPRRSGNLLATCAKPVGAVAIDLSGVTPSHNQLVGPADLPNRSPTGGDVASTGFGTFLLFSTKDDDDLTLSEQVIAFKFNATLDAVTAQVDPVISFIGKLNGIAAGLCVDRSPCAVISQSGDGGRANLVKLMNAGGDVTASVVQIANQNLDNPKGGTSFSNQGSRNLDDCAPTCQVASQELDVSEVDNPLAGTLGYATEGVFPDPRYNPNTGTCDSPAVALKLDFTGIPGLENVYIDKQHCAMNNGLFFVDVIDDGGATVDTGTLEWIADDSDVCYQTGDASIPTLEDVTYGIWAGDANDALGSEDVFAEDNLIGCGSRRRGGETFSFIIEGFQWHPDGALNPLGPPSPNLDDFGDREINESLDIVEFDSACTSTSTPCADNILGWTKALVGWRWQLFSEDSAVVPMTIFMPDIGAATATQSSGFADLDMTVTASVTVSSMVTMPDITGKILIDTTTNFTDGTDDPQIGDIIMNTTDLSSGVIISIDSPTQITHTQLQGGTENDWDMDDEYTITISDKLGFKTINDDVQDWTALGIASGGGEILIGQSLSFELSSTPRTTQLSQTVENVPFRVPSFKIAFVFDGPEFGDFEEKFQVTATLPDGSTLVGVLQAEYVSATMTNPTWSRAGATTSLLSPAHATGAAVIKVENPFGDEIVTDLVFEPISSPDCGDHGSPCTNQSDGSVYDLEIEVVDRVEALEFAYEGLLESLCPVSTRDPFNPPGSGPRRPELCEVSGSDPGPSVADFNTLLPPRNIAGRLQIEAESLARFIGHNICLLTAGSADVCASPPPWALDPTP